MHARQFPGRFRLVIMASAIVMLLLLALPGAAFAHASQTASGGGFYSQTNLVSDIHGIAKFTDPNLVNPWGLSHSPSSPWWISDNNSGMSTLYDGKGKAIPLVVTIPSATGSPAGTLGSPTGNVFNGTSGFVVSQKGKSGASLFIFATEDGTISGWSPGVNLTSAIIAVDNSPAAVYKGLAMGSNSSATFIYAANFRGASVDVFDKNFAPAHLAGSFTDPNLPKGYAPFGIQNLGGNLYVTYAIQDKAKHDDVAGLGHGFVDVYDTNGNLLHRLVAHGNLDSPWGLALAPANFGKFSNDLLVGNFRNGRINAFDPGTGAFLGQIRNTRNIPVQIDGLWGLAFGNGSAAGNTNTLFFTAGIGGEQHGLFGTLDAV